MVPPGLAFVCLSERAWKANESARMPRFYFDLAKARDFLQKGQTPWTPAVSVFFGLDVALEKMAREGPESVHARHASIGQMVREGVKALGLELLVSDERYASNTVTAVRCPEGVDVNALRRMLEDEYHVVVAGGQRALSGKIFRIGHLGLVSEEDIRDALDALAEALPRVGHTIPAGS
jgi:aspartate aminotransferase-like enzyme